MHAFAGLVSNLVDKSNPNLAPLNAQEHPPYGRGTTCMGNISSTYETVVQLVTALYSHRLGRRGRGCKAAHQWCLWSTTYWPCERISMVWWSLGFKGNPGRHFFKVCSTARKYISPLHRIGGRSIYHLGSDRRGHGLLFAVENTESEGSFGLRGCQLLGHLINAPVDCQTAVDAVDCVAWQSASSLETGW